MAAEKISGVTVGTVIAFVAPGFLGLRAIAYHMPLAEAWMTAAADKEQNLGVFFFVLLASLAVGVVLSGLRSITLDALNSRDVFWWKAIPQPDHNFGVLADEGTLAAFQAMVENYYRYYQFYGNSLIGVVLLWVGHAMASTASPWPLVVHVVVGLSLVALFVSGRKSLRRYSQAAQGLFSKEDQNAQRVAEESEEEGCEEEAHQEAH